MFAIFTVQSGVTSWKRRTQEFVPVDLLAAQPTTT